MRWFPYLLFRQVLCNLVFIDILPPLALLPFDLLDALALHVACAHKHALQGSQAKVVVALRRQLLVTQPGG